ncbi:hypothetical protein BN1051_03035 [Arthrobacter saudimassiliensis]|uniref:Lipoprotein n=1 Tax=Arthrobacter saudimassiliensis TaxID=1461584 RepID=A0A078MR51_9MICC|nr:hypothetical protein BN1051_03035 [Arthrobacter saudimassiliensis]
MNRRRAAATGLVLVFGLVGCAEDSSEAAGGDVLTWQEAKARAQAMELEIAESLPQDKLASVDQALTGLLIRCSDTSVNWHGATTVTLTEGTDPEPLVRDLEAKYENSRFDIKVRDPAPAGHYEVQLRSPDDAEMYIIKRGAEEPYTIRIASGSACFPWPEGEYMGGKF